MTVKAIDTNVLARFLLQDHEAQSAAASAIIAAGVFIPYSVLLETAWLLSSRYGFARATVADLLTSLLKTAGISVPNRNAVAWALERYRVGADFADMIHLVCARPCEVFATFDRRVAAQAGKDAPLAVETIAY